MSENNRQPALHARGRIYSSILETIGATPLVRLSRLAEDAGLDAELLAKLEFFNPMGSVKDRIGLAMIGALESAGRLEKDSVIVEPTSGNTGIALAFAAAAKGIRLILTMPESQSDERRKMLKLLGAELELTPARQGMAGAIRRAEELVESMPNAVMPQQFHNNANPDIHAETTAEEIWTDSDGTVDVVVSSVGTGGTLTGCGRVLKKRNPAIRMIAVEPEDSAVLSGGEPGSHMIEGIGAGFVPPILDRSLIDEVLTIANESAFATARKTAQLEGLPVGISSGAALSAALEIGARPEMAGKRIVTIVPSFAERYLSTPLFDAL
ncbi:MAG TPA: cysteine synthase A [Rhodospirillaceae bacterium]|nr:cysteine synthase A [Rhodospirillaceae bacterium]HAT35798.1 cysteine synthase A [Rhodospirillaceae bacterium]